MKDEKVYRHTCKQNLTPAHTRETIFGFCWRAISPIIMYFSIFRKMLWILARVRVGFLSSVPRLRAELVVPSLSSRIVPISTSMVLGFWMPKSCNILRCPSSSWPRAFSQSVGTEISSSTFGASAGRLLSMVSGMYNTLHEGMRT